MDAALLIGLDSGLDLDLIKMLIDDLGNSINNDLIIRERGVGPKNENYAEIIIPLYSNNLFKEHFRMSRISSEVRILAN